MPPCWLLPRPLAHNRVLNTCMNVHDGWSRVVEKSAKKSWSNARGSGTLFSVDLVDDRGSAIRATFFKDGVDRYFDFLQRDGVYLMANGRLKIANKTFSPLSNDYEISFDENAVIRCERVDGQPLAAAHIRDECSAALLALIRHV